MIIITLYKNWYQQSNRLLARTLASNIDFFYFSVDKAAAFGGAPDSYDSLKGCTNLGWPSLTRNSTK